MNSLIVFSALVAAAQAGVIAGPGILAPSLGYAGIYGAGVYGAGLRYAPGALNLGYALGAPLVTPKAAAVVATAPIVPYDFPSSQFQAQDEFGNLNYGYTNVNSAKQEVGNAYSGVTGSYTYVDANGIPQRTDYIADALGFRVKATNLPQAPVYEGEAPVFTGEAPEPVQDTAEVAAAKAEFQAAFDEAASREKRSSEPVTAAAVAPINIPAYGYASPLLANYGYGLNAISPFGYGLRPYGLNYGINNALGYAPVYGGAAYAGPAVSAPATREAVLTKIKLNPGFAEAYIVN